MESIQIILLFKFKLFYSNNPIQNNTIILAVKN